MKISGEVYNCLINQAIVMKHDLKQSSSDVADKVVQEYFRNDELNADEKNKVISKISNILGE